MSKGGEFNPMKVALPPTCDDRGTGVHADDQSRSRTVKGEERYAMDAPLPPYHDVDDDVDKLVRRRTMRARVFLALGLALEASSTLWAFQQARSAGALAGPSDCHHLGLLYTYSRFVDKCVGPIDAEAIYHFSEALNESSLQASLMEGLLVCDYLPDAHAGATTFREICPACDENRSHYVEPCSWVALSDPSDGICSPHYVSTNTSDGAITEAWPIFYPLSCRPQQPSGSAAITIAALAVALSSQLLEAFVGFKYWRETEQKKTAPTLAASIFETFGVIVVSSMLINFPDTSLIIAWSELSIIALVVVGALAEITGECSDRAARRFPYLGAVGNGLIWLGAALNEVILIIYFRYADTLIRDFPSLAREVGGLFAVELLGLVAMWIARGLWTKAKLLRASLKSSKGPLRKRDNSSYF